ncbi:DUF262 domain-containing protein [Paraburkholderia sp. JPY303]|uniref:DUF262 domain-containing protein n=1 Tax=Paraburkholderia atlantica TaxID=2654982 RepID=UPI001592699E|nr:DUF262 domain-containing protein [Paraburkholderia atlantica]NUY33009.1 DUF262 domain-containing protein [Paraburkholderia atlantica]
MKAEEQALGNLLTNQLTYEIPPYQRPYSWEVENVQQLLDDIWDAYETNDPEYFIGSLITIERERGGRYEVVDGQQRLTTLNLLISRLRDHIESEAAKAELGNRILPRNALTGKAETPRLLLRSADRGFFQRHVLDSVAIKPAELARLEGPQRRIAENVAAIDSFLLKQDQDRLKLFANYILTNVYVVFVTTNSWQSAYRLFNVLNARGMSLSNADLIKNALFSVLGGNSDRSDQLEERWLELETQIGIKRLDAFFGHYRTTLTSSKARGSLYEEFEPIIKKTVAGPFAFMDDVISAARHYTRIFDLGFDDSSAYRSVRALHRVHYDEWIPPLLAFLMKGVEGMPEADFVSNLARITMQNWVRRLGRTARLTVYYQLISAINNGKSGDEIREIFRRHARNDEFIELLGGEVYGKPFDEAVLLGLEEASQDESVTKFYKGQLTIEHILPQSRADQYWVERFTEDEHRLWIHRLGNLAMLAGRKNYRARNYDFPRKKEIYREREKTVSFDLTKGVCEQENWTADVLETRQDRLIRLARETWSIN